MKALHRIRKTIKAYMKIYGNIPKELTINEKEAEELGTIRKVDGIKLVEVKVHKDCFSYCENKCIGLKELYCNTEKCNFYRTDLDPDRIEIDIKKYAIQTQERL